MRIQYKGGVWKNSEDEILKAAVMKYGQNQWARIASLLVRKSAKQCKARWNEWLDPSIRKTPWTPEEEHRLLHLVKVMPTQWRTIAPMVGRTAQQCLEHYERLIDQAQQKLVADDPHAAAAAAADPNAAAIAASQQRPGDLDAAPESKPARPDPVDMDEDELEMLSEARARLANTKGKKAKRKAREKQLEAAKRVAQLQKRRELKAAGVPIKPPRKSRKVTDYATEIPFERTPAPGFYDTRDEDERALELKADKKQIGKLLQKYMGPTEAEKEEAARNKDTAKRKELEKTNIPAALGIDRMIAAASAPRSPPLKKARFSLPPPQLSDAQLEEIAKSGNILAALRRASTGNQETGSNSNSVADVPRPQLSGVPSAASMPVAPSTPGESWATTRQRHLETIMTLKSAETPLRGGETPVQSLGLDGRVTPATIDLRTPNPLATPSFANGTSLVASSTAVTSRKRKKEFRALQDTVRKGLAALPEPENEYEVEISDIQPTVDGDDVTDIEHELVEDAEDEVKRRIREDDHHINLLKKRLLSSAAQRSLPVPEETLEKTDQPNSAAYLADRDRAVLNIVNRREQSSSSHDETLAALRALPTDDKRAATDRRLAEALVDEYIEKDPKRTQLETEILEELEALGREAELAALDRSWTAEQKAAIDVSARNKEVFQEERRERLKDLEEIYAKHGHRKVDDNHESEILWQRLHMEISKKVSQIADESSLVNAIDELRNRISKAEVPSSLRDMYNGESKDKKA